MKNKNLLYIFLALLPAILIYSLYLRHKLHENDIIIYNPYSKEMLGKIDNEEFTIQPKQEYRTKLELGSHKVFSYCDKILINDKIIVNKNIIEKGGLLNLSNQPVYLWTYIYGNLTSEEIGNVFLNTESSEITNPYKNFKIDTIQVESFKIVGPVKEFSPKNLLIEKQWYFSITKPFQDEIYNSTKQSINVQKNVSKIFSKDDLIDYWVKIVNE